MSPIKKSLFITIMTLGLGVAPIQAWAQEKYWNFNKVDIHTLIQQVAEETSKNFVIDPRVQGNVTVISKTPLSKEQAYQVFLSVLQVHGYAAVETGKTVKIIPSNEAKFGTSQGTQAAKNPDDVVVKVFHLDFISSRFVVNALKGLFSKTSMITSYDPNNDVVVADTANNVERLGEIIQELDQPNSQAIDIVPIEHASAFELIETLEEISSQRTAGRSAEKPISLGADQRTNSVLISGGSKAMRDYLRTVIMKLDQPSDNQYNSEVVYLKYSEASHLAPIVATFLEDAMRSSKDPTIRQELLNKAGTDAARTSTQPALPQTQGYPRHLRGLKNESTGVQGQLFSENENQPKSGVVNEYVQWEDTSNALIIKAPPSLMRAVKSIISKLDIRRPQVLIEVIIAEVNLDRARQLGIEWNPSPSAEVKFGTRLVDSNGIVGDFASGVVNQLGSGLSLGVFRHGNLRALLKALSANTSANILATPSLVTLDNQTALIKVGQKVPFAIGQTNNEDIGGNPFTSFDREEVGLSLTLKPQITISGSIKLQIENILSDIIPNTVNVNAGNNPTTTERTVVTNVIVDDGKILVLGGLIQDEWEEQRSQVPFLGHIPVVGALFRNQEKRLVKRNLMIFIRPQILRDDHDNIRISSDKYNRMRHAQRDSLHALRRMMVEEPIMLEPMSTEDYYPSNAHVPEEQSFYAELPLPHPFKEEDYP